MSGSSQVTERADVNAWTMVAILTLAYTVSFIDRQVLNLLVEPVKLEFDLSDTQFSLLQGLAFTAAYVLFSVPFGRMADTRNRHLLVIFSVSLWSLATVACGLSRNYVQLFAARFGVGGAEAGLTPASWSMIAYRFPATQMPVAMSVFLMGPYLGGGLALIFGGLLLGVSESWTFAGLAPWQFVFVIVAMPGIAIVLLLFLFVSEPARRLGAAGVQEGTMSLPQVIARFRTDSAFYGNFYCGMSGLVICLYAIPAWMPTLLIRRFGVPAADIGLHYGFLVLVGGVLGVLSGPFIARQLERRGHRDGVMAVPVYAAFALVLLSVLIPIVPGYGSGLAVAGLASVAYSVPMALAASALQFATPNRMRGVASAMYIFIISVVGLGLAPTIVALITDYSFRDEARVAESLAITCGISAIAGGLLLRRARFAYASMLGRTMIEASE